MTYCRESLYVMLLCFVVNQQGNFGQESLSFCVYQVSQNELNCMLDMDICNSTMDLQVYTFLGSQPLPQQIQSDPEGQCL